MWETLTQRNREGAPICLLTLPSVCSDPEWDPHWQLGTQPSLLPARVCIRRALESGAASADTEPSCSGRARRCPGQRPVARPNTSPGVVNLVRSLALVFSKMEQRLTSFLYLCVTLLIYQPCLAPSWVCECHLASQPHHLRVWESSLSGHLLPHMEFIYYSHVLPGPLYQKVGSLFGSLMPPRHLDTCWLVLGRCLTQLNECPPSDSATAAFSVLQSQLDSALGLRALEAHVQSLLELGFSLALSSHIVEMTSLW